jgi:hypothetical protein
VTVRLPTKKVKYTKTDLLKIYKDAYQAAIDAGKTKEDAAASGNKAKMLIYHNSIGEETLMADITKVPLQRWHHFVFAYNNGVFDIFLNGILYRSVPGVMTDTFGTSLITGSGEGNSGKICNLVFYQGGTDPVASFTKNGIAITSDKVTNLYNNFASKNPPIISKVLSMSPDPSYAQVRPKIAI